jgi:hypothetical protein
MSFGGNYVRFMTNLQSPVYLNGSFTFSNQATGFAMSDYLLGDLFSFQQGNIVSGHARKNYLGLYAQDSWRITPKVTANYGVRWEPFLPVYSKDGQGEHFDSNNFNNGIQSKVYVNAPAGLQFPGDYPGHGNSYLPTFTHFEPRVGFSYDPRGKGLEVIRASYGLFYDFEALQDNQAALQSPPWADTITRNAPSGDFPRLGPDLVTTVNLAIHIRSFRHRTSSFQPVAFMKPPPPSTSTRQTCNSGTSVFKSNLPMTGPSLRPTSETRALTCGRAMNSTLLSTFRVPAVHLPVRQAPTLLLAAGLRS